MKIVFYDGRCGLCQRSISFLSKADRVNQLMFAPLNGETYKKIFGKETSDLSSVVFYDGNKKFIKSSAFLEIFRILGGLYTIFYIFKLIPRMFRDFIYDQIAKRRKIFKCIILQHAKDDKRFLN